MMLSVGKIMCRYCDQHKQGGLLPHLNPHSIHTVVPVPCVSSSLLACLSLSLSQHAELLKELFSTENRWGTPSVEMGCMGQVELGEFHLALDLKF